MLVLIRGQNLVRLGDADQPLSYEIALCNLRAALEPRLIADALGRHLARGTHFSQIAVSYAARVWTV